MTTEQMRPTVTVGPLIFNNEGKLFLMQSPKWHNKWVIPGGKIELGETMEHAVIREVKEETNLDVYDIQFLTVLENIFDPIFVKILKFSTGVSEATTSGAKISMVENFSSPSDRLERSEHAIGLSEQSERRPMVVGRC